MSSKVKNIVLIVVFAVLIVAPTILYAFLGKKLDTENYEQRTMAQKPVLSVDNVEVFPGEFEVYYADNMPFRNQFIKLNTSFDYHAFKDAPSDIVILGKKEWLFYNEDIDNQLDIKQVSEGQINQITKNLVNAQSVLADQGIDMMLYIVPDKARVYRELVPNYMVERMPEENSVIRLMKSLAENASQINVVFPYDTIMGYKEKDPETTLYGRCDTHWNTVGAYLGAQDFLAGVGESISPIETQTITMEESKNYDLTGVLDTKVRGSKEYSIDANVQGYVKDDLSDVNGFKYTSVDSLNDGKKNLFVSRDSFALALSDFIAPAYKDSTWVHHEFFDQSQIFDAMPDVYVYECIERNVDLLYDWQISFVNVEESVDGVSRILNLTPAVPKTDNRYIFVNRYEVTDGNAGEKVDVITAEPLADGAKVVLEDGKSYLVCIIISDEKFNILESRDYKVNLE